MTLRFWTRNLFAPTKTTGDATLLPVSRFLGAEMRP